MQTSCSEATLKIAFIFDILIITTIVLGSENIPASFVGACFHCRPASDFQHWGIPCRQREKSLPDRHDHRFGRYEKISFSFLCCPGQDVKRYPNGV